MKKVLLHTRRNGFSVVEVLLAGSIFVLLVTALTGSYLYGQEATAFSGNLARATSLAEEGLEAVRNIRDASYASVPNGTYGLATTSNQWNLSGSSDTTGIFTRSITIGTLDSKRKAATSTVTWSQNEQRSGSVTVTSRIANWQGSAPATATCGEYAIQEGYSAGTCRQNTQQCTNNNETHLSGGDAQCVNSFPGDPSHDTCCALP